MSQIEFQVVTDLAPIANTQIETNFEAVKEWLTEELDPYTTMVVTPAGLPDAKKLRAQIRKVSEGIDSQRRAIKKEWMKPYDEYEAKCKELKQIVSEAVDNIDGQIKEMESMEKKEKKERLIAFFDAISEGVEGFLTFYDIYEGKWLNATFAETDAANIITQKVEETKEALEVIRALNSPFEAAILNSYANCHSLTRALAEGERLKAIQKAENERRAKEEETRAEIPPEQEKAAEGVQDASETIQRVPEQIPSQTQQFVRPVAEPSGPKIYKLRFEVDLTREQANAMKNFLVDNGIKYRKI